MLQGDYYHKHEEVWPAYFQPVVSGSLHLHLQIMLLSIKKNEHAFANQNATALLANDLASYDYLDGIYHDASYDFAGYTLEAVEGNLELKEDVAA
jgi:hypothetical protein